MKNVKTRATPRFSFRTRGVCGKTKGVLNKTALLFARVSCALQPFSDFTFTPSPFCYKLLISREMRVKASPLIAFTLFETFRYVCCVHP